MCGRRPGSRRKTNVTRGFAEWSPSATASTVRAASIIGCLASSEPCSEAARCRCGRHQTQGPWISTDLARGINACFAARSSRQTRRAAQFEFGPATSTIECVKSCENCARILQCRRHGHQKSTQAQSIDFEPGLIGPTVCRRDHRQTAASRRALAKVGVGPGRRYCVTGKPGGTEFRAACDRNRNEQGRHSSLVRNQANSSERYLRLCPRYVPRLRRSSRRSKTARRAQISGVDRSMAQICRTAAFRRRLFFRG